MTKTFGRNGIINENFTEVPNLAIYLSNTADMSRTYQVNRLQGNGVPSDSTSTVTTRTYNEANSTTQLYVDEESSKSKLSKYLGIAFLLGLVLLSITFLTFAIFYDEIIDDDNETAEEYWERIQNEIKMIQNSTRAQMLNRTLENGEYVSILTDPPKLNLKPSITFENYSSGSFQPKTFYGKWISSNELLHFDDKSNLIITNVNWMNSTILIPSQLINKHQIQSLSLSADRKYLLQEYNSRTVYRYSSLATYRIYSIQESQLLPALTSSEYMHDKYLHYAEWGPIGSQIVFVQRNDIFYKSSVNSPSIRITKTGEEMLIYNGIPDWVYEEEITNGPKTFWVSPDGNDLVFASINDSAVDIMTWPYYGSSTTSKAFYSQYTKLQSVRYPKPGRPNPTVSLYYIPLSSLHVMNNTLPTVDDKIISLVPPKEILDYGEYLFTTFTWISTEWIAINWMNRAQNFSVMTLYTYKNNFQPISNFRLQSSNGWIDLFKPPLITPDGSSYLIRVPKLSDNKREIFEHIARISVNSAKSEFLTSGVFEVKKILDINSQTQRIYFMATFPGNPGSKHLLSVPLNQSIVRSEPICHTCLMNTYTADKGKECLTSDIKFSVGAHYYIFECYGPNVPRQEIRNTTDHSLVYVLEDNHILQLKLNEVSLPKRILTKVTVDHYDIDVMLIVPEDFNENSTTKYPLLFNVYGGPGSDSGAISQSYFYNQYSAFLVSNRSVIYAFVDARGNPNHGSKFMFEIYRKIGFVEVEDTVAVAKYFRDKPYINENAISIWGWSYGGYLSTMALESDHDNTIFSCGIAVAPVSDWLYYDSVYVERFMGFPTPDDNLKNYLRASTLDKVHYLRGKQYLIMFGTADDNVHAMNSMMLLKALNEANIQYQTQIYPDKNHGLHNSLDHVYRRMTDFLDKCYNYRTPKIT